VVCKVHCRFQNIPYFSVSDNMSELVWGIKNGDLDQVKDIVEQKVRYGVAYSQAH